jgi:hypothetical protein
MDGERKRGRGMGYRYNHITITSPLLPHTHYILLLTIDRARDREARQSVI